MIPKLADAEDCNETRAQCDAIIQAFEKEVQMKDLMIEKQYKTLSLLEKQRDEAYELAQHNPRLFDRVMLGITGVGIGCAAMGQKEEVRLICLAGALVACALGGC